VPSVDFHPVHGSELDQFEACRVSPVSEPHQALAMLKLVTESFPCVLRSLLQMNTLNAKYTSWWAPQTSYLDLEEEREWRGQKKREGEIGSEVWGKLTPLPMQSITLKGLGRWDIDNREQRRQERTYRRIHSGPVLRPAKWITQRGHVHISYISQ